MSFGFTPNFAFVSRICFAAVFHAVHSLALRTEGTSSAFIFLKSQLLLKLFIIVSSVHSLSFFTFSLSGMRFGFPVASSIIAFPSLSVSSTKFFAFMTQMCLSESGVSAEIAIFSDIEFSTFTFFPGSFFESAVFPNHMESWSESTFFMIPTPHALWKT